MENKTEIMAQIVALLTQLIDENTSENIKKREIFTHALYTLSIMF